ncbi:ketopantoate reductase family protein [Vibrio rumoiensis]|uniref:2-dehydropantoate 2-reductase n=1 Tax=Vibrio rumoiensis 1S-45 TaxID=1188252 RepID=A0A1E5E3D1_9VIBR|nr:2-dehydropantoate 2-reductase [Vibrio rumoiensis]OEF26305.1 2-dehydropantoate 2-reductase [Vibrio rumoiensis 1S-45]
MKIGIVGLGAIGSLWAVKCHQNDHQVVGFTRSQVTETLSIQLDDSQPIRIKANDYHALQQCQLLLVTVKSTQVTTALEPLHAFLNKDTPIIFLHNGMGAVDALDDKWHKNPLLLATTTQAAFRPIKNQVNHTGAGQTLIGPSLFTSSFNLAKIKDLIVELDSVLPRVKWCDDIHNALWNKLIINCVINPLTAIHQCRNGELASDKFKAQISWLIDEICQVISAEKIEISHQDLVDNVYRVIQSTAQNFSSMNQDIAHHRATEIDFITGYLMRTANKHGLTLPHNQALMEQIKALQTN